MGKIKGHTDLSRWQKGERLTRQEAIEANCFVCNGGERVYCGGERSCPLYKYSQFNREVLKECSETTSGSVSGKLQPFSMRLEPHGLIPVTSQKI